MSNLLFSDLGVDPVEGAEIIDHMGITQGELSDPQMFGKVKDIIQYFQGKEDKRFVLNKILAGKGIGDKITHVLGYVTLRKERDQIINNLSKLEEEIMLYER